MRSAALLTALLAAAPAHGAARVSVPLPPSGGLTLARAELTIRATSGKLSERTTILPSFAGGPSDGEVLAGPTTLTLAANRNRGTLTALVAVVARASGKGTATVTFTAGGARLAVGRVETVTARVARIGFADVEDVCGFHARTMTAALKQLVGVRSSNPGFAGVIGMRPAAVLASTADVFCHLPGYDAPRDFLARVRPGYKRPRATFALAVDPTVPTSNGVGHVRACLNVTTSPAQPRAVAEIHIAGRGVGTGADQNLPLGRGGGATTHFTLYADGPFTVTVTLTARNGAQRTVRTSGTFDHTSTQGPERCVG